MKKIANLRFGNFRSYNDYRLNIAELEIGQPQIQTKFVDVPYRNGSFDFTDLYGASTYSDRSIKVKFQTSLIGQLKTEEIYSMYDAIISEIYTVGVQELEIDNIDGVFTGRCISISPVSLFEYGGEIDVEWRCNPFRQSKEYIGCNDIWDTFHMNTHVFNECMHDNIKGRISARLFNNSPVPIRPVIVVIDQPVLVEQNGVEKTYEVGEHISTHLLIHPNRWNPITIKSFGGSVRFKWKRIFI